MYAGDAAGKLVGHVERAAFMSVTSMFVASSSAESRAAAARRHAAQSTAAGHGPMAEQSADYPPLDCLPPTSNR